MRQRYLRFALAGALAAIGLAVLLGSLHSVRAQSGGATVTFIVPQGTPVTAGGDVVIYIAQPSGSTTAIGCTTDSDQHPIQSNIVTDPGGARATRISGLITLSQTTPVANGTRVGSLVGPTSCTAIGINFDKYEGTVQ